MKKLLNLLGILGLTTSSSAVAINLNNKTNDLNLDQSNSNYVDYNFFTQDYTVSDVFEYDQNYELIAKRYDITSIFQTFYDDFNQFRIDYDVKQIYIVKIYADIFLEETSYLYDFDFYYSLLSAKEVEIKNVWIDFTKDEDDFYKMSTRGDFVIDGINYTNQKITDVDEYRAFNSINSFDLCFDIRKINEQVNHIYESEISPIALIDYGMYLISIDANGNIWQITKSSSNKELIVTIPFRNIILAELISDNEILIVNQDSSIYKFNLLTKELIFINKKENVNIELTFSITLKNNNIYFSDYTSKSLINYNLDTNQYTTFYTLDEDPTILSFRSMIVTSNNKLFVTTGKGILLKFNASTLKLEKRYTEFQHGATVSIFEYDNKLFVYSVNKRLWSLDLNNDQITLIGDLTQTISSFIINEETNEVYAYYALTTLNIWKMDIGTGELNLVFEERSNEQYTFQGSSYIANDKFYTIEKDRYSTKSKIWEINI